MGRCERGRTQREASPSFRQVLRASANRKASTRRKTSSSSRLPPPSSASCPPPLPAAAPRRLHRCWLPCDASRVHGRRSPTRANGSPRRSHSSRLFRVAPQRPAADAGLPGDLTCLVSDSGTASPPEQGPRWIQRDRTWRTCRVRVRRRVGGQEGIGRESREVAAMSCARTTRQRR